MTATMRLLPFALAALLAFAGCSSTPPTRFHTLQGAGTPPPAAPATAWVDLGPVAVPPAVDQPQWVVRLPDDSLRVLEQERWAGPLRDELRAALLAALGERHGLGDARTAPPPAPPAWRVRVDVLRFDTAAGRGATLEARWTAVPPSASAGFTCATSVSEPSGGDPLALAAAHRRAVGALADRMGASLSSGSCAAVR
jgi:uncharacterized lipoprotein YmbA